MMTSKTVAHLDMSRRGCNRLCSERQSIEKKGKKMNRDKKEDNNDVDDIGRQMTLNECNTCWKSRMNECCCIHIDIVTIHEC